MNPGDIDNERSWEVELCAAKGELAQAEKVVIALKADIERADSAQRYFYWYAQGCLAFAGGDYQTAIGELERAVGVAHALTDYSWGVPLLRMRYLLGRAYLMAGMLDRAVEVFERALRRLDWESAMFPFESVKCHYYLGQAYEQSGWKTKAIEQYQTFLDIWKDTDRELPEMADARARLARLGS